jgi:hypothetical protein
MSKQIEALLQSILEELRVIRVHLVPAPLPDPAKLENKRAREFCLEPIM